MRTIKGPGIFLAQFLGDKAPFNALEPIARGRRSSAISGSRCRSSMRG